VLYNTAFSLKAEQIISFASAEFFQVETRKEGSVSNVAFRTPSRV